jgi:XTP/dITP diphosphohydrolase
MHLLIATRNAHKTEEIRAMLDPSWTVTDLNLHPEIPSPNETGSTFLANAEIKAAAASLLFPGFVLADDSGLEVDALDGAPGVRSARYAGDDATDADNRAKLLSAMRGKAAPSRARFRCAMALAHSGRVVARFEGSIEGELLMEERGTSGFGYDPLFVPEGETQTFAELPSSVKNRVSHRGRALAQVVDHLRENLI